MRVLVVHNRYRSAQPSGEDRVVDRECALLAEAGHEVDLFERRSDDIALMSLPQRALVPVRVPWNPASRHELRARLRADRPDIVHVHNTFPLLSASVLAACADEEVPVVASLHNYQQVCPTGTLHRAGSDCTECVGRLPLPAVRHGCYRDSRLATLPVAVARAATRRVWWSGVARFFCVSDTQRRILVEAGMPPDRLTVKHHFVPDPGLLRSGPGEHVLYLGRLSDPKGLPTLMRAWDSLAAAGGIGVPLVLAGGGELEESARRWARGRADVRFLGLQDDAGCRRLTAAASAVVLPSTTRETFGLVVVEAMATGVPVVASRLGALAELVVEGRTGLLHEPGDPASLADALRTVVTDRDLNRSLGSGGRRRYEEAFTPAVGLEALVSGYREVIAASSPRERLGRPAPR
ncbi:glycosyltransferase family 4 protein [Pseudonocardia xishanensis]|uniref:Glycosyltransferase n=1 Tax=Pseudonocardia xishanensis TaxID=630995 RepID=A0ABP8S1A7_9PSEU